MKKPQPKIEATGLHIAVPQYNQSMENVALRRLDAIIEIAKALRELSDRMDRSICADVRIENCVISAVGSNPNAKTTALKATMPKAK